MRASSRAMLWYFWRMSRRNILLLMVASLATALFVHVAQEDLHFGYINLIVQTLLIAAFSGCLFLFGTDRTFLPHPALLTLPMSTSRYLRLFYGYLIAITVAVSCAATTVHLQLFGDVLHQHAPRVVLHFWQLPLLCTALACLMQSLFHLSGIKNEFRVVPMAIAMEVLAFRCILPVLDVGHDSSQRLGGVAVFAILFAWASSYNSLVTHRNGRERGGIIALLEWLDLGRGRTRSFTSAGGALFWLGWRRCGRLFVLWALGLTLVGLGTIGVFLLIESVSSRSYFANSFYSAALLAAPMLVGGAAFLCHILLLMRGQQDLFGPGRAYFLTLPVRSTELTRGCTLSVALSVLLVVTSGLLCLALAGSATPGRVWLELSSTIMKFTPLYTLGLWLLLWFGLALAVNYLISLPVMIGATILGVEMGENYALITLAAAGIAVSVYCLVRGIRLGLLRRVDLGLFSGVCVLVLATVAAHVDKLSVLGPRGFLVALTCFCALLPVALPFIGAPLLMNWIRHR